MTQEANESIDPNAISVADAATLLTKAGGQTVSEMMLRADVAAGAPTNSDGTLNLVQYAAWMIKETKRGD